MDGAAARGTTMGPSAPDMQRLFGAVAPRYDLLNHLLSCGADYGWRRAAARLVATTVPGPVLDVACGTGDLAGAIRGAAPARPIVGVDVTWPMLSRGKDKMARSGDGRACLCQARAESLPFADGAFAAAAVAFGLRNFDDRAGALAEMRRVLVPGGRAVILEFSLPRSAWVRPLYRGYLHHVLPRVAGLLSAREAYQYLSDSVETFPEPAEVAALLDAAGFEAVGSRPLTGGIVTLYWAERPRE